MPADPPGFRLRFAARTEWLLADLVETLAHPLGGPTARECIVVQSQGMSRWLELQLSAHFGIWANPWFPFPEELLHFLWRDLARPVGSSGASARAFDREGLAWAVAAVLPGLLDQPAFEPLCTWAGPRREPARLLALARRIGAVFHGYLLSRPDLLEYWEARPEPSAPPLPPGLPEAAAADAAWQAILWRALVERAGAGHPARRAREVLDRLEADTAVPGPGLERFRRVSVFGLSALSPLYVRILAALGRHVPVTIYALAASPADALRLAEAGGSMAGDNKLVLDEAEMTTILDRQAAPPLVEGQGRAARVFQVLLGWQGAAVAASSGPAPAEATLLGQLQADLAAGRPPQPRPEALRAFLDGADASLGLHSCHGPLREVEVLRDQLLDAFNALPDLAPHEVVVMVPDVEAYAPYVEAVFGSGQGEGLAIPFHVADRSPRADRPGALAFSRVLHALRGRLTAPEVLDLLGLAPVREARRLDEEALASLRACLEGAGIRWGLDAEHRAAVGQPALAENTWRWGLTRLMLGWAAPGDGQSRYLGVLPSTAHGVEAAHLGALAEFCDFLARWRAALNEAHWLAARWWPELGRLLAELLGIGRAAETDRLAVEAALGKLAARAAEAGYDQALNLDAVSQLLDDALDEAPPPRGFLEGAVTVCALQPMRAIPFRVLALMGLNDGAFPRSDRPPGFDLAARQARPGDSLRRDSDRLLFLEALASARDRLILTWTGQDARSDADLPPSVVVSEVLDVLRQMAGPEAEDAGEGGLGRDLVLRHPLQAFSPRYFGAGEQAEGLRGGETANGPGDGERDRRLFSHVAAYARTAGALAGRRRLRPPLVTAPLPPSEAVVGERLVRLDALARFLEAPARRLARDRLRLDLPKAEAPLADREPMVLGHLERHQVGESLLAARLAGAGAEEAQAIVAAEGRLPLGTPGRLAVARLDEVAQVLAGLAAPLRQGTERTLALDLPFPELEVRLVGSLDGLWPAGRLEIGYGRINLTRKLRLWVRHLALNVALEAGQAGDSAPVSWALGRPDRGDDPALARLAPVPAARQHLAQLLALWFEAESTLLPFFPRAAWAYAQALVKDEGEAGMLEAVDGGVSGDFEAVRSGKPPTTAAREAALRAAAKAFGAGRRELEGGDKWGDKKDLDEPYLALTLGDALPWDEDDNIGDPAMVARFEVLAGDLVGPLLAALTETKGAKVQNLLDGGGW